MDIWWKNWRVQDTVIELTGKKKDIVEFRTYIKVNTRFTILILSPFDSNGSKWIGSHYMSILNVNFPSPFRLEYEKLYKARDVCLLHERHLEPWGSDYMKNLKMRNIVLERQSKRIGRCSTNNQTWRFFDRCWRHISVIFWNNQISVHPGEMVHALVCFYGTLYFQPNFIQQIVSCHNCIRIILGSCLAIAPHVANFQFAETCIYLMFFS